MTDSKLSLTKFKEFFTLDECANLLNELFHEDVSVATVLQLGIERRLTISANFVNGIKAQRGTFVTHETAKKEFITPLGNPTGPAVEVIAAIKVQENEYLEFEEEATTVRGIWELPMIGGEFLDIKNMYQQEVSGSELTLCAIDGTFIRGDEGEHWRVVEWVDPADFFEDKHRDNPSVYVPSPCYVPVGGLPENEYDIVVKASSVDEFRERVRAQIEPEPSIHPDSQPIAPKTKGPILRMLLGMAMLKFDYNVYADENAATGSGEDSILHHLRGLFDTKAPSETAIREFLTDAKKAYLSDLTQCTKEDQKAKADLLSP